MRILLFIPRLAVLAFEMLLIFGFAVMHLLGMKVIVKPKKDGGFEIWKQK